MKSHSTQRFLAWLWSAVAAATLILGVFVALSLLANGFSLKNVAGAIFVIGLPASLLWAALCYLRRRYPR